MLKKVGRITRTPDDQQRPEVPPGQFLTDKFPVLTFGATPNIDLKAWRLRIFGLVAQELVLNWEEFMSLPQMAVTRDFHCVTQWSRLDNLWEGISFRELVHRAQVLCEARYVMTYCFGGYTANLPLQVLMEEDVLLAHSHDGKPLEPEHGGPLRLIVPSRYGWKSAKWVNGFECMSEDMPGFWEQMGYHNNGDPWQEERFS